MLWVWMAVLIDMMNSMDVLRLGCSRVKSVICLVVTVLTILTSCSRTPEQRVADALNSALKQLREGQVDNYMQNLDFGQPLDSLHYSLYSVAIRQQIQHEGHTEQVVDSRVQDVKMQSDTLATAFYTLYLANGDSLCMGQKMVRAEDGSWKLRMKD